MKRIFVILLAAAMLLSIAGCTGQNREDGQVVFYYKRAQFSYGEQNGVIAPEYRSLDTKDMPVLTLLNLYVDGPGMAELVNVFPENCEVLAFSREGDVAAVEFNKIFGQLQSVSQTVACVCMSRTVMELTGVKYVRISARDVKLGNEDYLEFDQNSVFYFDDSN